MRDTWQLAREMLASGLQATLTCIDPKRLSPSFSGRRFDAGLLADLPAGIDPCGEKIEVSIGETVERDGFIFTDLLPRSAHEAG